MKIRIQADGYLGYEVVAWRWWWPFWCQLGGTNTHYSVKDALRYAKRWEVLEYVK